MGVLQKSVWVALAVALGCGGACVLVFAPRHAHDSTRQAFSDPGGERGVGAALPVEGKAGECRTPLSGGAPTICGHVDMVARRSCDPRASFRTIDALARTCARQRAPWRSPGHLRAGLAVDGLGGTTG
ncbi:MAG: hypothetical protein CVU56_02385 [Deltaproteobacteria bacterium HGW-Deltaproteobacteria-14]|jgi:hypothetical protein|nr:MAG: hypothetical protein CVU56_02385 [Deltaproteobacteria bacterium HGW-Deltaproteobacteria-14]